MKDGPLWMRVEFFRVLKAFQDDPRSIIYKRLLKSWNRGWRYRFKLGMSYENWLPGRPQ